MSQVDIAIVGAGPAGLCLARAFAGSGLSVALVDQQPRSRLAAPTFDGREIALTHSSRAALEALGIWDRLPTENVYLLREAKVMNGPSLFSLDFDTTQRAADTLGWLVPNQQIRLAAWASVDEQADLSVLDGTTVTSIETSPRFSRLIFSGGASIKARLVVAADSRFSVARRMLGIGAQSRDYGKCMLVCRMRHARPHHHTAWEWFGYGKTLALLPLDEYHASAVVTLSPERIEALMGMDDPRFEAAISELFEHRLGDMHVDGSRHAYPLVGVYADRFAGPRCALVGDAAVGMHPVTAHGFNFGLQSLMRLATAITNAHHRGRDIADPRLLNRYEREHRLATRPLYEATHALVSLYTDDRLPARLLRNAALRLAQHVTPFRAAVAAHLTHARPVAIGQQK
ncbi:5-demethoxyubiquinol-8 5-hydroxylase UbiM [Pseudomonas sp. Marseille-QA0892]